MDSLKRELKQAKRSAASLLEKVSTSAQEVEALQKKHYEATQAAADKRQASSDLQKTIAALQSKLAIKTQQLAELRKTNKDLRESLVELHSSPLPTKVVKVRQDDRLQVRLLEAQLRKSKLAAQLAHKKNRQLADAQVKLEMKMIKYQTELELFKSSAKNTSQRKKGVGAKLL